MAAEPGLSATAYVVLGLVSIRPVTGYDLTSYAQRSIGNFFPLTRSHIYTELDRLHRLGLLEATQTEQQNAPTKRTYEITLSGRAQMQAWLEDPELREDRTRSMFLVRIFFGDRTTPERLTTLLDEFESAAQARRDRLAALVERLADRPEAVFRRATAVFGLRREEANLHWVAEMRPALLAASAAGTLTCGDG
jgi:DNA-binding PadR family transcriptional regulator